MKNCLVLGATGFIGGNVARVAFENGWRVRAARRDPHAVGAIGDVDVKWVNSNLDDCSSLVTAMRDCDVVFHCAGAYPHGTRHIDRHVQAAVKQMQNVLDAARAAQVDRLIYTSSFTTIGLPGDPGRLADERDFYQPGTGDAYYEAKWVMEVTALRSDLPVVALCPSAVFGPGDVHLAVSEILIMAAKGRVPFYIDATFGMIDVRDAAAAHLHAAEQGKIGERYILSAHNLTLQEGLTLIARVANVKPPSIKIGPRLLKAILTMGQVMPDGMIGHLRNMRYWQPLNNTKAVNELGLTARPAAETLHDALAWFRANGYL